MKKIIFALTMCALALFACPRAQADVDVSFDFFYNNLPGGSWIEAGDYGYCWQPDVAVNDANWRPYSDGYWAYTDVGWTWVSYEDFGWACYHYGRWVRLDDYGWVWAPGRDEELEWGPAWVSWRTGGDYIGWAPLPPEVSFVDGRPIHGHVDIEFDIGPACYNFVEVRYIGEPVLRERIFAPVQNVTYIQQTVNVTNITYKNKVVYNYGPDINIVNTRAARPIQRLKLERQENVDVATAARTGALTKVQGQSLIVAAPMRVRKSAQGMAPPQVKAKVQQVKVDKGWRGVGNEQAQTQLKERIKAQDLSKVPPMTGGTGAASQPQASVATSPMIAPNPTAARGTSPEREQGRRNKPGQQNPVISPTVPGTTTTTPEREGRNGRRGNEQFQTTPRPNAGISPNAGMLPSENGTTTSEAQERRGGRRDFGHRPAESGTPLTGTQPANPDGIPQNPTKNSGRRNFEEGNARTAPSGPTDQGQGQGLDRRNRGFERPTPGPGGGGGQMSQGGGQGMREGRRAQGETTSQQPSGPAGAPGSGGQEQREGRGDKNRGASTPVPSPHN